MPNVFEYLLELALRSVAAEHSERPMYFVLPALRISSRAGIDSVRGVSTRVSKMDIITPVIGHTGIYPVQIVEIRGEAKSLNRAFDVLLDVRGRVGHRTVPSKDIESTFRCDYM